MTSTVKSSLCKLSQYPASKCTAIQLKTYLYRLEYGLGNVNNAQTISLSFPPSAFLTRWVAAFLPPTTKRLWPFSLGTAHCCCRIGKLPLSLLRPLLSIFPPFSTGSAAGADDLNHDASHSVVEPEFADFSFCFSIHCPTRPTTSSLVSISHNPSVAMTTKSPFEGSISVLVTTGSAETYGGVFSHWCGVRPKKCAFMRSCV